MKVLLGITGGIAAYKSATLVRELVKADHEVRVVMTRGAQEFITPMTLQILSEAPVGTELFDPTYESEIGHIDLARWADAVLVAPATAQVIAKVAAGMAGDLLTTVLLATRAPVVVAPAMNTQMWQHVTVQRNVATLRDELGHTIISPDAGELACKEIGAGRLPDPPVILAGLERAATPSPLRGQRVLVTAGPTREHLDPARFLSNPSSGKMGYALAGAAWVMGAEVTLVSGPTALEPPPGVAHVGVTTAQQMYEAVMARAEDHDVVVKAAAVADWRPSQASETKVSKGEMTSTLALERTPDILAALGARFGLGAEDAADGPTIVGFAAESHDVLERARAKLERKGAHWLVANRIGGAQDTFGADAASVTVLPHDPERPLARLGPAPKPALARMIWGVLCGA